MAIKVQTIQVIIELITFLLAYTFTVTIAGSFRAWVADFFGDSTAKEMGFTSLNPLVHIDPIGLFFLLWFYFRWGLFFAWGRLIPINPSNFVGPLRIFKIIFSYFSDTLAYFLISLSSLATLIVIFDTKMISLAGYMVIFRSLSQLAIMENYPEASALTISIAFILIVLMYLAVLLGVLSFIINVFSIVMYVVAERTGRFDILSNPYLLILIPLALLIVLAGPLQYITIQVLLYVGYFIANTFHIN